MSVNRKYGFTLIEMLTVVSIMVVLFSIVAFSIGGVRSSAKDEKRKADLSIISSGLEKYKSDCGVYPSQSVFGAIPAGGNLIGNGATPSCKSTNVYIREIPKDPDSPSKAYFYSPSATGYSICASLDTPPEPAQTGVCIGTGSCGSSCNYIVNNP